MVELSLSPILLRAMKSVADRPGGVSVHTLVSERTWRMGVLAVSSFEFFSNRRWNVWVHDDGTLTARARDRLTAMRPHWHLVSRAVSDALALEKLSFFPHFLRLRERHPLAVKMADAWLWAQGPRYLFIDSDCLFFANPDFILKWVDRDDGTSWFMQEYREVYAYAFPPDELNRWAGIQVMPKVNTGIGLLQKDLFNWERVEKLLARPETTALDRESDWYIEQTLCAVLLTDWGRGGLLPTPDYVTGYDAQGIGALPACVACHYVGPTKYDRYYYHGLLGLFSCWLAQQLKHPSHKTSL
jgi:hypothetical protein